MSVGVFSSLCVVSLLIILGSIRMQAEQTSKQLFRGFCLTSCHVSALTSLHDGLQEETNPFLPNCYCLLQQQKSK